MQEGNGNDFEYNDLVLVFKPHKGFTKEMFNISRSMPDVSLRAFLDGPYGGLSRKLEAFETVLMIAGGSGITPIVGHLQHLVQKILAGEALTKDIRIVWAVKDFGRLLTPSTICEKFSDKSRLPRMVQRRDLCCCPRTPPEHASLPILRDRGNSDRAT